MLGGCESVRDACFLDLVAAPFGAPFTTLLLPANDGIFGAFLFLLFWVLVLVACLNFLRVKNCRFCSFCKLKNECYLQALQLKNV